MALQYDINTFAEYIISLVKKLKFYLDSGVVNFKSKKTMIKKIT